MIKLRVGLCDYFLGGFSPMNKKNWISALMAVMMVLSMLTAVSLPAMAADEVPGGAVSVTAATAETAADGVAQSYYISNWDELLFASKNPTFFGTESLYSTTGLSAVDTVYLTTDLDVNEYPGGADAFKTDFTNFNGNMAMTFDGLGHTIYNYTDTLPFFRGRFSGVVRNLSFEGADVTLEETYGSIVVYTSEHGMTMDNMHIRDSKLTGTGTYTMGGLFCFAQSQDRKDITVTNCSVIDTHIEDTAGNQNAMGLLAGRFRGASYVVKNVLVADGSLTGAIGTGSEMSAFVVGNLYSLETGGTAVFENIGVYGNVIKDPVAGSVNLDIVTANRSKVTSVSAKDIFAAGNKLATTGEDGTVTYANMANLFFDLNGASAYTLSNYMTDGTTTYAVYGKNATTSTLTVAEANKNVSFGKNALLNALAESETYGDWGYDAEGNLTLLEEGESTAFTLTLEDDKAFYRTGETVTATVAMSGKVELAYFEAELTYDSAFLVPVSYTAGDITPLDEITEFNAPFKATYYNPNAVNYTAGTLFTVSFTVTGDFHYTKTPISVTLSNASAYVMDPDDPTVATDVTVALLANPVSSVQVVLSEFIAGDVNRDEKVGLMDAALLLQKLSGTLHASQDGENFDLYAANVINTADSMNEVNTLDLVQLLEYMAGNVAELELSLELPTIVAIE